MQVPHGKNQFQPGIKPLQYFYLSSFNTSATELRKIRKIKSFYVSLLLFSDFAALFASTLYD